MGAPPKIRLRIRKPPSPAEQVKNFLTVFDNSVQLQATNLLRSLASKIVDEVRSAIDTQAYAWKPLSPEYKAKKVQQDYDPRILIRSGFYRRNIEWWMDKGATGPSPRRADVKRMREAWRKTGGRPDSVQLEGVKGKRISLIHVGVRNIKHPDSKLKLPMLARIHEFGTDTIPPRPHWRPAFAKVLGEFPKLRREYYARVRKALRAAK